MPTHAPSFPPAAHVAEQIVTRFDNRVYENAICLTTPVPELVPVSAGLRPALQQLLTRYEPQIATNGLYAHQAKVLQSLGHAQIPNIVMTTATGSGKSLAFLAWAVEILARNARSTVIATFPTQALLWGQAKRLASLSEPNSRIEFTGLRGIYFAGTIRLADVVIPWSVWYGTRGCAFMREHEESSAFATARLRLTTLDKCEWSLMQPKNEAFLAPLAGLILDEAHSWHGLAGANVRRLLDRLRLSMDMQGRPSPAFFLASATLAEAGAFAADLTGVPAASFLEVDDRGAAKASLVKAGDVPQLLAQPAKPGLLRRYVLLVEPQPDALRATDILQTDILGPAASALCFVQSKFIGHRLWQALDHQLSDQKVISYDGDLPAHERRRVENELFSQPEIPKVIVGTSALELGIDLPALDVVVMDDLPPRRCDLLQRLGRVGRSSERPGLAVLCLGYAPGDERLIEEPLSAVAIDDMKPLALPLHLETVRLRSMSAAFNEWRWRLKRGEVAWDDFNDALERYFGWAPHIKELQERVQEVLGDLVDLDDGAWFYKGFRVSASQGKYRLVCGGETVAVIEDTAIFRDAHPEGIYLGHRGSCYRVRRYVGNWNLGTWTSPEGMVLGKFMKGLDHIEVSAEQPTLATRGRWIDTFRLDEPTHLPDGCDPPATGALTFGLFRFLRKFDGYLEIDLLGRTPPQTVTLAEVAARFNTAIGHGEEFPFLHNFSYRTKGWTWSIARVFDMDLRQSLAPILGPLLQGYFCDVVECAPNDLQVTLEPTTGELRAADGTPGGNGLSEALLSNGRVATALATATRQIAAQAHKSGPTFQRFLAEEYRVRSELTAPEVADALQHLADAWQG